MALSVQEMCLNTGPEHKAPDGLRCVDGLARLASNDVLGELNKAPTQCAAILDKLIAANRVKQPNVGLEDCQRLAGG